MAIHQYSNGIPRVISVICDNALVNGLAADQKPVGAAIVHEVCRSLSLGIKAPATAPVPAADVELVSAAAQAPMFASVGRRRFSFF